MTAVHQGSLKDLFSLLRAQLPDLRRTERGFEVELEGRYGKLSFVFDYDADADSIRVYLTLPTPAGAGPEFLRWCLSMNTLYWDVKVGLDASGMLLVLSDVDLGQGDPKATSKLLLGRVIAIGQLVDDDLVAYLLDNRLATAAQRDRWRSSSTDER